MFVYTRLKAYEMQRNQHIEAIFLAAIDEKLMFC